MRVVHCTSVHAWNDVRIFVKMASSCAAMGHETHVVALDPRGPKTFIENAVTVHLLPSNDLKGRFARATSGARRIVRYAQALSPDFLHFHDPELLPWVVLCKSPARKIYDVHEDLPRQISTKGWIPSPARPLVAAAAELAENLGVRSVNSIVAATPTIADRFPSSKTTTVRNFPIASEFAAAVPALYSDREPIFTYIGGITAERGLFQMMSATKLSRHSAQLCLAGPLPSPLMGPVFDNEPHVIYAGVLDRDGIGSLLSRSRAGLCLLHPTKNYPDSLPVKMFEYMAAGLPVIVSDFPLWREIVGDGGICVDPLNAADIAAAMNWVLEHPADAAAMGQRGKEAVHRRYNWHTEADALRAVYTH